jgi:hypothetical protein
MACATEAPAVVGDGEPARTHAVLSVEHSEPAAADTTGSASAIARFVNLPAVSDPGRILSAAGATLDLPAVDTCLPSGSQGELEPPLPSQGGVEFVEAGDVNLTAGEAVTPLVPHAFPTVGGFASGVLYTTRDRTSEALPTAVPYLLSVTGSSSVAPLRVAVDAPRTPVGVTIAGVALADVTELHTGAATVVSWAPGESGDSVYAELLAYDGSPSVLCTFRDEAGAGTVPAEAFAGTGAGRLALHRVRSRHVESAVGPSSEIRFDFQVGSAIEFSH